MNFKISSPANHIKKHLHFLFVVHFAKKKIDYVNTGKKKLYRSSKSLDRET